MKVLPFSSRSSSMVDQQVLREKEKKEKKGIRLLASLQHLPTFEMLLSARAVSFLCTISGHNLHTSERSDLLIVGIITVMERRKPVEPEAHSSKLPPFLFFLFFFDCCALKEISQEKQFITTCRPICCIKQMEVIRKKPA